MDKERIGEFANAVYRDMAGAMAIGMGYLGLKSGLFEAMKDGTPVSSGKLAEKTGLQPRYVEEWLNGMTAAGWLEHDEETGAFSMPDEHGFLLASEGTDHYMGGLFLAGPSLLSHASDVARAFREGGGVHFDAFDEDWIKALDLMNGGAYKSRLASYWMKQLPDIEERLASGGRALDIGCGVGKVSLALAEAYPEARITGFDPDGNSVSQARSAAADAGADRVEFVEGVITDIAAEPVFDFAGMFDCLHDLAEPEATLAEIRSRMAPGGALMVMEPRASDRLADNFNPLGTVYYGFSLFHCMTQSLAQGGPGLGTCMGPDKTMSLLRGAGFSNVSELPIKSQINIFFTARA
ncbi:class I SAM-dependent methyltransferase [Defluviimonas salinarum]|uniref:Methyltransferase domain-containing protein n=1 Tax=Defluviimonas salinarum TaxID=2992147 RepID=A0ABT3J968_9RHOB|nr:class I SAM-dependent methyltransferase [Defluviimonas salinarum]MCW3784228.1 methyltransferase domain-containing protein [Defluviimonas salinarum]